WRTGDRLALSSKLRRINGFGNFGELDWAAYNARRGLSVTAYAWREDDVTVLEPADGFVDRQRRRYSEACERVGGQGAEILEALTIGDRTGIDRETSIAVRDAGLAHFLAISGSHMALIVVLVVGLVRWTTSWSTTLLERFDVLRLAAVLAAVAVVAYSAVSGGGVSVARSVLMALAAMAALWRGRPGDDLRALGGSAIVLALVMPGVGEEAGFQLSYLAVTALIMDARRRRALRRAQRMAAAMAGGARPAQFAATAGVNVPDTSEPTRASKVLTFLFEAARLTFVCWVVTSPVVAHHFQRISLVAPLANVLAAPLVSAIVVSGIGGLVLLPVNQTAGDWVVEFGAFLSGLVIQISVWCASLPLAATTTPSPGLALTAVLSCLALAMLLPPQRGRRALIGTLAAVAALLLASAAHDRYRSDHLDVWFASVGQGDAAIVRMPGGEVWVVDQGPPGRGRMVVAPLLRRAWIGRVDVLVASHVQSDHSGALTEILEEFEVGEVWLPDGPCDNPAARAIGKLARERGVPVRLVSTATPLERNPPRVTNKAPRAAETSSPRDTEPRDERRARSNEASVDILWPPPGAAACNANDQSLVLAFGFAGRRVLFTGDIEKNAEWRVAAQADVRADVLKVPHHGSRTSSTETLLDAVKPSLAVASLGLDNHFRFPAPDVVARYVARNIPLLRTDRDGAVHLTIDATGNVRTKTFHQQ
ncbi:MAG: DNA internalization-related competence protein ComEC/Rec2, partial [Candidatus Binatia bacterium]